MYVKVENDKVFKELVTICRKSGRKITGVSSKSKIRDKRKNENYLYYDVFCEPYFTKSREEGEVTVNLEQAKRFLSRPVIYVNGYCVTKSDKGLQIGCTFFPNKILSRIYDRVINPFIVVGDYKVSFTKDEHDNPIIQSGYRNYSREEIEQLAKFAGLTQNVHDLTGLPVN